MLDFSRPELRPSERPSVVRLMFDEDMNHHVIRGLIRRLPELDCATVLDLARSGDDDMAVLRAAAAEQRLLVSHDVNTMSAALGQLLAAGETSYGLLLVPQSLEIGRVIEDLELVCRATENEEWVGIMEFLPI